jgi:hypothetical protein
MLLLSTWGYLQFQYFVRSLAPQFDGATGEADAVITCPIDKINLELGQVR